MEVVFLDANVLYSAAYKPQTKLRRLWELGGVRLVSSAYAVEEARLNLADDRPGQLTDLEGLLESVGLVAEAQAAGLPRGVSLVEKDRPILLAAIEAQATHLLTGDKDHFGHLFGTRVKGVLILPPAEYLREK